MENVEEIQQWGPLDDTGRPIKERAGEDYNKFIKAMCSLGYAFDSRELVAADYGAPTTRKRWYAIFRRDHRPIIWPEPTHSKDGHPGTEKWLPCGDFIDWSDLGKSIFDRPKPLADATMRRIANGYRKYVVEAEKRRASARNSTAERELELIKNSTTYKVGKLIMAIPCAIKRKITE